MRAVEPTEAAFVTGPDDLRIASEVFGAGDPMVFLPSTPINHSRQWKAQVPFFSRRHRVVVFDGLGNSRSPGHGGCPSWPVPRSSRSRAAAT